MVDRDELIALVTTVLAHDPDCHGGRHCDCTREQRATRLVDKAIHERERRERHW